MTLTRSTPSHLVVDKSYGRAEDRRPLVAALFDGWARHYDRVGRSLTLGSGPWYRRHALLRGGLRPGMKLLDVATGTGLLAREAENLLGGTGKVVGVDPSAGMLSEAQRALRSPLARGWAEALPFRDDAFDMLSLGYALGHVASFEAAFREFLRVLRPGGRLVLLEIAQLDSAIARWLIRTHLQQVLPRILRLSREGGPAELLVRHLWDTIDRRVPPQTVLDVLRASGFVDVQLHVLYGFFSEYGAVKPAR